MPLPFGFGLGQTVEGSDGKSKGGTEVRLGIFLFSLSYCALGGCGQVCSLPCSHTSMQLLVAASSSCPFRPRMGRISAGAVTGVLHYPLVGVEPGCVGQNKF